MLCVFLGLLFLKTLSFPLVFFFSFLLNLFPVKNCLVKQSLVTLKRLKRGNENELDRNYDWSTLSFSFLSERFCSAYFSSMLKLL